MARSFNFRMFCVLVGVTLALLFGASVAAAYDYGTPAPSAPDTPGLARCTVILMGRVTDGTSPISGALVRAYTGSQPRGLTGTDRSGNFVFANPALPANARYEIGVQTAGRPEIRYGPFGPFNCGAIVNVGTLIYAAGLPPATRSIQGTVWSDRDGDTQVDAGEPRWLGWQVILLKEGSSQPAAMTTTDSQGHYRFLDLVPARYKVAFIDPARHLSYTSPWLEVSTASRTVDFDFISKRVFVR
jgi:hypothetical protein